MIKHTFRLIMSLLLSLLLFSGVVAPVSAKAQAMPADALSYAYGGQLDLRLLAAEGLLSDAEGNGIGVLDLMGIEQLWRDSGDNGQSAEPQDISLGLLEGIYLNLPNLRIPLIGEGGLLDGLLLNENLGLLKEYANAPSATEAHGAVGLVNNDGSLNLGAPGDGGNISLDLTSLLKLDEVLAPLLDKAAVELGAVSAAARKPDSFRVEGDLCTSSFSPVIYDELDPSSIGGTYPILDGDPVSLNPDDGKFCSDYQVSDAIVVIDSPLVDNLTSGISDLLDGLDTAVDAAIGEKGLVNGLLGILGALDIDLLIAALKTDAGVSVDLKLDEIVNQLIDEDKPLSDSTGLVTVNLGTGQILLDLDKLHEDGLNSLPPNTPLVSGEQLLHITEVITNLLTKSSAEEPDGLNARLEGLLYGDRDAITGELKQTGGLYAAEVTINLEVSVRLVLGLVDLPTRLNLTTTLGGLLNPDATTTESRAEYEADPYNKIFQSTDGVVGAVLGALLGTLSSITGLVGGVLELILFGGDGETGLVPGLLGGVQDTILSPLLGSLNPLLTGVLQPLANIIVNRQKVEEKEEGNLYTVSAVEVNLLSGALATIPLATASVMATSFDPAELQLGKFVLAGDTEEALDLPTGSDFTLNYVCTHDDFEQAYADQPEMLERLEGTIVLRHEETETITGLPAGASCEITEPLREENPDPVLKWALGWITQDPWDGQLPEPRESLTVELAATEPSYAAAVNMYESALIDLEINVARIGTGRELHTGGHAYEVLCSTDDWDSGTQSITYPDDAVGEGFTFSQGELSLAGGAAEQPSIEVLPGATCEVTTSSALAAHPALRPTGADRRPYTYFLSAGDDQVRVAAALESNEVTLGEGGRVMVNADEVGAGWKTHATEFTIPVDAESHELNVVHAYDIDTRDVVVSKQVLGAAPEDAGFEFQHAVDEVWSAPLRIGAGEEFTIPEVPVLGADLQPTSIAVREVLGSGESGPVVSWELPEQELPNTYGEGYARTDFEVGPVTDVNSTDTPPLALGVTNSYAEIEVDKHIEGLALGGSIDTTVLPHGQTEMQVRYEVSNTGPVPLDTIRIFDPSLNNALFTLPEHITVDPGSGLVSGCSLIFDPEGVAACEFTLTLVDPERDFHYRAEEARVTAEAGTLVEGREIRATAVDKHGALRLSDILGMLPNTGVTTLVWVLLLGLLGAVAAVVLYVRSRRN